MNFPSPDLFLRVDVKYLSEQLLGLPFDDLKTLVYPEPTYREFTIVKRNGTDRLIQEPRRKLKEIQLKIYAFLTKHAGNAKPCVHGFVKERSIVTNAERHSTAQTHHLLNIDLKDFFPSINFYRVRGVFQKPPFSCSYPVATLLAHICTYKNALPQGAPTSPMLANLVCRNLDSELTGLAKRHRATYTRYADDITFSFSVRNSARLPENICQYDSGGLTLGQELLAIIDKNNFFVNPHKSRLSTRSHRMEVTGLTVNSFPNVKRVFIDRIRGALHSWEKFGYHAAASEWEQRVKASKQLPYGSRAWKRQWRSSKIPKLNSVLRGRLLYLRMVRGSSDAIYNRLAERYNRLCGAELNSGSPSSLLPVEHIVRDQKDAELATLVLQWMGDYMPSEHASSEVIGGQGTAFLYQHRNRLITCDHVLRWQGEINGREFTTDYSSPDVSGVDLTVHSPTSKLNWPVKVIARDMDRDLALLEFVGDGPGFRHFSGLEAPINKHEKAILIGYPNWNAGRVANQVNTVVVNKFPRRGRQRLEISANIRKGNSGGPLVNELFQVAGVAQEGATQEAGNDECLSVEELNNWILSVGI